MNTIELLFGENMPYNLAICGEFGTGKTTWADHVIEKYGYTRVSLAKPVKLLGDILADHFELSSDKAARRRVYQKVGMYFRTSVSDLTPEAKQQLNVWYNIPKFADALGNLTIHSRFTPDFWLDVAFTANRAVFEENRACLDDVRFPNEPEYFKARCKLKVLKLEVPFHTRAKRLIGRDGSLPPSEAFTDASEAGVSRIAADVVVKLS